MTVSLNPYIVLDGQVKEAIEFYKRVLGAEVALLQTFGGMPPHPDYPLPEEAKDRIAHVTLKIGDSRLMLSDTFPGQPAVEGSNLQICIVTDDPDKSKAIFAALAEGGNVSMDIQETFWSAAYGELTDKFGIKFNVTTETNG